MVRCPKCGGEPAISISDGEVLKMESQEISTMEAQELIYKRRVQRMRVTKGIDRGKLIDKVNAISKDVMKK